MAGIVIVDAGPLIALARIGEPGLLKGLFGEVRITASVRDECLAKPGADSRRIEKAIEDGWLVVARGERNSPPLSPSLGQGESDSIRLAMREPGDALLVMDDRLARRFALGKGLNIVGTVRLLDLAERLGRIDSAERLIDEMRAQGCRISTEILRGIRSG